MNKLKKSSIKNITTLKDLKDIQDGVNVNIAVMVISTEIKQKTNGDNYLYLRACDVTGTLENPIWNDFERYKGELIPGKIIVIDGIKKTFDGKSQINISTICEGVDFKKEEFIGAYNITKDNLKEFVSIINEIKDKRYIYILEYLFGLDFDTRMVNDESKWNKFFEAPAAIRHHGNKKHGLFMHTLGVIKAAKNMLLAYTTDNIISIDDKIDTDLLMFCAAVHDYGKIYEYDFNPTIAFNEDLYVGHEILVIGEIAKANDKIPDKFTQEELSKIYFLLLTHHGQWAKYQPASKDKFPAEARLLHLADMVDSTIVGEVESN